MAANDDGPTAAHTRVECHREGGTCNTTSAGDHVRREDRSGDDETVQFLQFSHKGCRGLATKEGGARVPPEIRFERLATRRAGPAKTVTSTSCVCSSTEGATCMPVETKHFVGPAKRVTSTSRVYSWTEGLTHVPIKKSRACSWTLQCSLFSCRRRHA